MYTQKIANIFDHIQDHSRLGLENKFLENKSGRIFLRSTSLLYKILPTSLGTCKPTFYTFYTSHLRWNSTTRRCFYHTHLRQNAVFHNFSRQIALIQYSEPYDSRWAFNKTVQKISKITYTASRFSLLTSPKFAVRAVVVFEWTLAELRFNVIKNLLCLFFYLILL